MVFMELIPWVFHHIEDGLPADVLRNTIWLLELGFEQLTEMHQLTAHATARRV